jgi:esterase
LTRRCCIAPSLRHFFPEHWDGVGSDYTMAQHVADAMAFVEALRLGPVDLLGHSRGGHVSFRLAQQRPDLVRRLILAEPGGELDESLLEGRPAHASRIRSRIGTAVEQIRAGRLDDALGPIVDAINGDGAWQQMAPASRQIVRDNARTLIGQVNEQRKPFTRADAEAIRTPTLIVTGADSPDHLLAISRALAAHILGAQAAVVPDARHWMFEDDPRRFCETVLAFLA